jgi:hypothetical protein
LGLDGLSRIELVLPMLALLVTLVVSGPATLVSYLAWKCARARVRGGFGVRVPRALCLGALVVAGGPTAYSGLLATQLPGLAATLGLVFVTSLSAFALGHAAYRAACIRLLADARRFEETETASRLSSFTEATRRHSLLLAGGVLAAWLFCAVLLAAR